MRKFHDFNVMLGQLDMCWIYKLSYVVKVGIS